MNNEEFVGLINQVFTALMQPRGSDRDELFPIVSISFELQIRQPIFGKGVLAKHIAAFGWAWKSTMSGVAAVEDIPRILPSSMV